MSIVDNIRSWAISFLQLDTLNDPAYRARVMGMARLRDYVRGRQPRMLKVAAEAPDDNITINLAGLVVSRSISLLFGKGVAFDLPGGADDPAQLYLDQVWKANKQPIRLHDIAEFGATYGTCYAKLQPYALGETELPRIIPLNPLYLNIQTAPEDLDDVLKYTIRYNLRGLDGRDKATREEITRQDDGTWLIERAETQGGKWAPTESTPWPYDFPPILHWKNLPDAETCYGKSDIDNDVLAIQDAVNFAASNINKILRYHAHPKTWGRGFGKLDEGHSWGAEEMILLPEEKGDIHNLEMQSDLGSSTRFMEILRQMLFDISRTVDVSSMADKLGALTNFGLRVLYVDALAKIGTKRELYGDALVELNHRLLVLGEQKETDGGKVVWPDVLPVDEQAQATALKTEIEAGILSKETAAGIRGRDWKLEQERMSAEKVAGDNVGALLLRTFGQGR